MPRGGGGGGEGPCGEDRQEGSSAITIFLAYFQVVCRRNKGPVAMGLLKNADRLADHLPVGSHLADAPLQTQLSAGSIGGYTEQGARVGIATDSHLRTHGMRMEPVGSA